MVSYDTDSFPPDDVWTSQTSVAGSDYDPDESMYERRQNHGNDDTDSSREIPRDDDEVWRSGSGRMGLESLPSLLEPLVREAVDLVSECLSYFSQQSERTGGTGSSFEGRYEDMSYQDGGRAWDSSPVPSRMSVRDPSFLRRRDVDDDSVFTAY